MCIRDREIPWEPAQQCFQERQPVTTPTGIVQGARRRGRRGDRTLDPVRRVLFHSATSGSTEAVPPEGRQEDPECDWRLSIFQSYATEEVKPPSPMGFRWAPAAIFSRSSVATIPVSPQNSNTTWGPDSPEEQLEENSIPEVPGWPQFEENGELLRHDSPRWKARLLAWRSERTRSSPLRVEGSNRLTPYYVQRSSRPTLDDVRLPSPPTTGLAALLKLKRELCRSQYPPLPRRRRKCTSQTAATRPTTRSLALSNHPPTQQHTPDIEIHAPEDLL